MSRQVVLELSDEVLDRAEKLAKLSRRNVSDVLADAVAVVLPPLDGVLPDDRPVSELCNEEVLELSNLRLAPLQDRRLSALLDAQQSGTLTAADRTELLSLMQVYEATLLRQAEALPEAVRRGIREPMSP
jgi:hypothetical protein